MKVLKQEESVILCCLWFIAHAVNINFLPGSIITISSHGAATNPVTANPATATPALPITPETSKGEPAAKTSPITVRSNSDDEDSDVEIGDDIEDDIDGDDIDGDDIDGDDIDNISLSGKWHLCTKWMNHKGSGYHSIS